MNLHHAPFVKVKEGTKTLELRLYDEKRAAISPGDTIVFTDTETGESVECLVLELFRYPSFRELYARHDKISIGYEEHEKADPDDLLTIYSQKSIDKFGVVGIGIRKL